MPPLARTTPVTPPMVNMKMNPSAHNSGVLKLREPPQSVANQENTLMPVGTAITIADAVKYIFRLIDMPTANQLSAQTLKPNTPYGNIAYTIPRYTQHRIRRQWDGTSRKSP